MGSIAGGSIELFLIAAIILAATLALLRNRGKQRQALSHRQKALIEELEEHLTLRQNNEGKLAGECIGHPIEITVRLEGKQSTLAIDLPLSRHLSTLALTALTPGTHPKEEAIITGDDVFDPRFHVHGDPGEALVLLGRETRDALVTLCNTRPGIWWESISIREQRLRASLQLNTLSPTNATTARCASMIRELVYCASVLGQQRRSSPFTRLVSEAAKQQAPGYRRRCLDLLSESYADNLGTLRAHPDIGLRFICYEHHPEFFKEPAYLQEMLLEIAHNHEDVQLRARALEHLSELIDEAHMEDDDQPLLVRLEALENASSRRSPEEFFSLAQAMLIDALPSERSAIIRRLAHFEWPRLPDLLLSYARQEDLGPVDAETLLEFSKTLSTPERRALLESLLDAPSVLVRAHTIRALAKTGGSRTLSLLREARTRCGDDKTCRLTKVLDQAIDQIEDRMAHAEF